MGSRRLQGGGPQWVGSDRQPVGRGILEGIGERYQADQTKKVIIEYNPASQAAPVDDTSNAFRKKIQLSLLMGGQPGFTFGLLSNLNIVARETGNVLEANGGAIKEFVAGSGSAAIVGFNHKDNGIDGRPTFIALAHELVHAHHYLHGMCYRGIADMIMDGGNTGIMEEEMRTVGFGRYSDEVPSENKVREEHGVALRASYSPNQDFSHVVPTAFP